jgi:hypothetical protein
MTLSQEVVMEEVWKQVPSYPDIWASSLGRIKMSSIYRSLPNGGSRSYEVKPTYGHEEKKASGRNGVGKRRILRSSRHKKTFKVHRLICEAFHGLPKKGKEVCIHINEDPTDNRPENLMWATQKENLNMPLVKEYHRSVCQEKMAKKDAIQE